MCERGQAEFRWLLKFIMRSLNVVLPADTQQSLLFWKYFDTINIEESIDSYSLINPDSGIDLILRMDMTVGN